MLSTIYSQNLTWTRPRKVDEDRRATQLSKFLSPYEFLSMDLHSNAEIKYSLYHGRMARAPLLTTAEDDGEVALDSALLKVILLLKPVM